ncbi:MAG: sugar porter family MFS transporter [Bacteroidales bacterium]|nr:sugar porter family MFS transporter [Bacteroidales bacterium]
MKVNYRYLLTISLVTALGGLLFGFDISVISGTIPFIQEVFELNEAMKGWVVSSALIGCILGASYSGRLGDKFGRKKVLLVTSVLFGVSAIGSGLANSIPTFIFYRIFGGLAVGGASVLAPMYIAEVSPAQLRGRMVSINQLTIVIGISLAYYSNYFLLEIGENSWRWMFAAEAVPSLLFFMALFIVPESPRWLVARNDEAKAKQVLEKVAGSDFAGFELKEIKASLTGSQKRRTLKQAFKKKYSFILFLGIFLAVFQQWSGINVIFFYAPDIFAKANLGIDAALFQTTLIGIMNILFTILAMQVIDKIGRKIMMLIGAAGMTVCYIVIGYLFLIGKTEGWLLLTFIIVTPAFFAFGLGPTVWVVLSEIFPNKIRGAAMSVATFSLWVACYLLTLTFPILVELFNTANTFWIYAVICVIGFIVIYKYLPETKGISLEKLEKKLVKE